LAQECIDCNEETFINCEAVEDNNDIWDNCGGCEDDWGNFCPSKVGESGHVESAVRTVASGAVIIPAIL